MTTFVNVFDQLAAIAQVVRKAPSTLLRRAYVKAYRDWCAETRWLRDTVPGRTVANTMVYDLGSDPYLEIISVRAASSTPLQGTGLSTPRTLPLTPQDSSLWDPNAQPSRPQRYCYIPEGQIAFYPTPDQAYNMLVTVVLQPKDGVAQVPSIQVAMLWMVMKAVVLGSTAAISSNTSVASRRGRARPPAASGAYRPQKPSSPALAMASLGKMPSASHSAACGASSARAKSRAVWAKARCSSVSSKSMALSLVLLWGFG